MYIHHFIGPLAHTLHCMCHSSFTYILNTYLYKETNTALVFRTLMSDHNPADVSIVPCQSSMPDTAERQSRTTIITKKTTIISKTFKEEEFINDQWVTTDEYQVLHQNKVFLGFMV